MNGIDIPFISLMERWERQIDWAAERKAKEMLKERYKDAIDPLESLIGEIHFDFKQRLIKAGLITGNERDGNW